MTTAAETIVIDASVALALLLEEPEAPVIRRRMARWSDTEADLVVPTTFWLEVINPLARRYGYVGEELLRSVHDLDTLDLRTVDPDRSLLVMTIDVVERFGLTAFDAQYLALAEHLDAGLATLDAALSRSAGGRAISFDSGLRLNEAPAVYEHEVTWPNYKGASAYLAKLRAEALAGR